MTSRRSEVPESKTRSVTASQVRSYVGKAEEFLDSAVDSLAGERYIAATSLAIHAAINAADAITGARLGRRAAGQDHDEARRLLQQSGPAGADAAKYLGRLLPLKTRTEYEPDEIPGPTATRAVEWARRMVSIAREVVASQ